MAELNWDQVSDTIRKGLTGIWDFKIATIDNSAITTGTILIGLLFLVIGLILAKFLSRRIVKKMAEKAHIEKSIQFTIERLSFYVMLIVFSLFAMRLANLPITIFTLLGGALAIGIGFGSQNIVSNFISGLILMFERPIKVGDFVEIDSLFGEVVDIGMRSTHIHTFGNKRYIVPNSSFLEKNVVNWTHQTSKFVRMNVKVGLAYGSPVERARELLIKAACDLDTVLSDGAGRIPEVYFMDFGDNSLLFELNYWIKLQNLGDFKTIQSDLRFSINKYLAEEGIVIAFPQRDVHLYPQGVLSVELNQGSAKAPS